YQKRRRTREELVRHLSSFELDLKLSIGMWYLAPSPSRFHDRYGEDRTINDRIKLVYDLAELGVRGVEAHYPREINEDNAELYRQLREDTGVRLVNIGPYIYYDREFEFGSLSNPVSRYRDKATKILTNALQLAKEMGADHVGIWPGIDGYTYSFGTVFYAMWDAFEDAVAQAMDTVPGVRVALEPKPYEPIPNNIYRTTADGLLAARDIEARLSHPENKKLLAEGHALVGMQPEIGHILMGFEDAACAFARICREGRLAHTHWNSQPLGNFDQDLNVGVVGWEHSEAALYVLKMVGYQGYFGIDINPERIPVRKAIEINAKVLKIMNDRINSLPHEKVVECYFDPEQHRGDLELVLAESRKDMRS
ncbi:MAG: TIM barrel protein, partial [Bacillota bacterium]